MPLALFSASFSEILEATNCEEQIKSLESNVTRRMQHEEAPYHLNKSSGSYSGSSQDGYNVVTLDGAGGEAERDEKEVALASYKTPGYLSYGGMYSWYFETTIYIYHMLAFQFSCADKNTHSYLHFCYRLS